jgi:hypothetical protein
MLKFVGRWAFPAILVAPLIGVLITGKLSADVGPTTGDLKAAMINAGIKTGATFELNGKIYALRNISISKVGPDQFTVSLQTIPQ